ncbi:hypothetical protein AVEN_197198-1 [Araneus ventricosus]|uniref:Uncharacterized protein n=1 Tax=Araneus ventricosus TaxID=182803 RepID=A0A4Y2PHB1_ARAVE|nr:hypothetical protein AVEN_197198-1 [Araneus ventricosus]
MRQYPVDLIIKEIVSLAKSRELEMENIDIDEHSQQLTYAIALRFTARNYRGSLTEEEETDLAIVNHVRMAGTSRHPAFLTRKPLRSESSGVSKDLTKVRMQLQIQNNIRSCRFCGQSVGPCLSVVRPVLRLPHEYVETIPRIC